MRLGFESKGSFKNFERFANAAIRGTYLSSLEGLAKQGVAALEQATPKDSSETAGAWSYKIKRSRGGVSISWHNDKKTVDGDPIIILLQYGHGTGTGGWVEGEDIINPAIKPTFDAISKQVRKAVKSA